MSEEKGLVAASYSVQHIKDQMDRVHDLMKTVMKEDEHYGVIPGTKKKSLWKQGAEKLSVMFRLSPEYSIEKTDLGEGHREISVSCKIIHIPSQTIVAEGVGSCSTMESKFRYRNIAGYDVTDDPIPQDAKDNKSAYRKQGYGMKKDDDLGWVWVKFRSSEKQENPDIADVYNTVLKMAKKRAHIDGILTATAASDIFTQDYEPGEQPEPPPPEYETEQQAIAFLNSCRTVNELQSASDKYYNDCQAGKTGWSPETWDNICVVISGVKERIDINLKPKENNQEKKETMVQKLASVVELPENKEKIQYLLKEGIIEPSDLRSKDEETASKTLEILIETKMEENEAPYGLDD